MSATLGWVKRHRQEWAALVIVAGTIVGGGGALALDGYPRLAAWLFVASVVAAAGALALAGRPTTAVLVVVVAAVALRWIVDAALLEILTPRGHYGTFNADEVGYDRVASALADGSPVASDLRFLVTPYTWLLAGAYDIGGTDPLAGKAVTGACGVLVVGAAHRIVMLVDGRRRAAIVAAVLVAAWPTTLGWSATLLRDSTIVLGVALAVLGLLEWRTGRVAVGAALALVASGWLIVVRPSDAAVVVVGELIVGMAWLARRSRLATAATVGGIVLAGCVVALVPALNHRVDAVPDQLRTRRVENSSGNTRLGADVSVTRVVAGQSTWARELERLPSAAATVWLRPAPWEIVGAGNTSQRLGATVAPLWYLALLLSVIGVVTLTRRGRPWEAWMLAAPVLLSLLPLAMGEGNLGTAVRHRDSVSSLLLVLTAIGTLAAVERAAAGNWHTRSRRRTSRAGRR